MNSRIYLLTLAALLLTACDEDQFTRSGYISYKGDKYPLHEGYMNDTGTKIFLISSSVEFSFSDSEHYSGKGNAIQITDLPGTTSGNPAEGTYDLKDLEGGAGINYDFDAETYDYSTDFDTIISGTCTIVRDGDEFEITVEFRDENETVVKGYFKGPLVKGQ